MKVEEAELNESSLLLPKDKEKSVPKSMYWVFFILGAGGGISWYSIGLSVAYFQTFLGPSVLSELSFFQTLLWLGSMIFIILYDSYSDYPQKRIRILYGSFLYMMIMSSVIFFLVLYEVDFPPWLIYALVFINGASVGICQAFVASFAALYQKISLTTGVIAMQMAGGSFGVFVPVVVNAIFLPFHAFAATPEESHELTRESTMCTFGVALIILLLCIHALTLLQSTNEFKSLTSAGEGAGCKVVRKQLLAEKRNECDLHLHEDMDFAWKRLYEIKFPLLIEILNVAVASWFTCVSPHIPPTKISNDQFWKSYLATILIMSFEVGAFLGRLTGVRIGFKSGAIINMISIGLLVGVAGVWIYLSLQPPLLEENDGTNIFIISWFILISLVQGMNVVWSSEYAQTICNHSNDSPCTTTGQWVWIALQVGSLVGISVSFLPVPGGQ